MLLNIFSQTYHYLHVQESLISLYLNKWINKASSRDNLFLRLIILYKK